MYPVIASRDLAALLPEFISTAEQEGEGDTSTLLPAERGLVERCVPLRANEFASGRACAHKAMADLGIAAAPLLCRPDRRPAWPPDCTGSITHTEAYSVAAVARLSQVRSIGIDSENLGQLDPALWRPLFDPAEVSWIETHDKALQDLVATLIFSAKESFYKCQYPLTGQWLEFTDVRVIPVAGDLRSGHFDVVPVADVVLFGQPDCQAKVRYSSTVSRVLTAMAIMTR